MSINNMAGKDRVCPHKREPGQTLGIQHSRGGAWLGKRIDLFMATLPSSRTTACSRTPAAGSDDDDELFELLLAVSDWVDHYCNRHFYPRAETLLFDGPGGDRLLVPDLISVAELVQGDGEGRSFDKVWDSSEYRLLPHNASPLQHWGHPHGAIRAGNGSGEGFCFRGGQLQDQRACGAIGALPNHRALPWPPSSVRRRRRSR